MHVGGRILASVALAAMLSACEERVRECDGGVEVVIVLADPGALDRGAADMVVTIEVDGRVESRSFETAFLDEGATSFILDLQNAEEVELVVTVEIAYDGPGNGAAATWLRGEAAAVVPGGDSGCERLEVPLALAPDGDGDEVPDAADRCPEVADDQSNSDADAPGDACDVCVDVDDPAQLDGDGDLAGDACDLCPELAEPRQHDEDSDAIGDGCDPCPHIADAGPPVDTDGDLIGDACDPRPATAGDQLAIFLAFDDPGDLDALTQVGSGSATIVDDTVEMQNDDSSIALYALAEIDTDGHVVTRSHRIADDSGTIWGDGVIGWIDPDKPEVIGFVCMAEHKTIQMGTWPFLVPTATAAPGLVGVDHDIKFTVQLEGISGSNDSLLDCYIGPDSDNVGAIPPGNGQYPGFGLIVADSTARFDFLFIVDSP